ncbi:MAG: hypothetical protein L3K19_05020 [Thermoplasmata archaeon]|nr:hypothetical protein [Thermoplasmata archaeon]
MSGLDAVGASEILGGMLVVGGLAYAAWKDWRTREVSDRLWQLLAAAGALLGLVVVAPGGWLPEVLWLLVSGLVLEHLIPWDEWVEGWSESLPGALEVSAYVGLLAVLGYASFRVGVGTEGVPVIVLAVYVGVVLGRGLFELGVLYGGADAKAVIVVALLLPIDGHPLLPVPPAAALGLSIYPFALTLVMDAALLGAAVPIGLAVRNIARGEFSFPQGFTGYMLAVSDLPHRFVWLRDPTFRSALTEEELAVETAAEDQALRARQSKELEASGVARVWVTPQIPFVILLAAGAVAAVLWGNLVFDLAALL